MKFTADGRSKYRELLAAVKKDKKLPDSFELLLTNPRFVEEPSFEAELPVDPSWATRFQFAEACYETLGQEVIMSHLYDGGLWDWIVARYFKKFCKSNADGTLRVGATPTLFLKPETWNRYYRHHAAGPIFAYQAHPETAAALVVLANPLDTPGELAEQFLSRHDVLASHSSIGAATLLYIDPHTLGTVRGAAGKDNRGTSRRYGLYLKQLELTYDLGAMKPVELLRMLPAEYNRFVEQFKDFADLIHQEIAQQREIEVAEFLRAHDAHPFFIRSAIQWLECEELVETFADTAEII
jgi:hypothetical protein